MSKPSQREIERVQSRSAKVAGQDGIVTSELEGLKAEYDGIVDAWKAVDTKAQVAIAAASIFLGAAFALVRDSQPAVVLRDKGLLVLALVSLVVAIIFAFKALLMRRMPLPPRGVEISEIYDDLYQTDAFQRGGSDLQAHVALIHHDLVKLWRQTNKSARAAANSKGVWTLFAQGFIALGAIWFGALSLAQIYFAR